MTTVNLDILLLRVCQKIYILKTVKILLHWSSITPRIILKKTDYLKYSQAKKNTANERLHVILQKSRSYRLACHHIFCVFSSITMSQKVFKTLKLVS